jgi:hypothetical protein
MKMLLTAAMALLLAAPAYAGTKGTVSGQYVEARTAEVFTGGCIMGSEAETVGRQAILAWHITRGAYDGVALDNLSVVAAVAGNRNLGISEIGGEASNDVKATIIVDANATEAQRNALVALARELSRGLIQQVVEVKAAPIAFADDGKQVSVAAADARLTVAKELKHDPSCGAMQWFHPLAAVDHADLGMTQVNSFSGVALGTKWSDPNRRSAFFGTFSY